MKGSDSREKEKQINYSIVIGETETKQNKTKHVTHGDELLLLKFTYTL